MTVTNTLKDHVSGDVTFEYAQGGELWYKTHLGLLFPVPFDDVGTARFNSSDRGTFFMRWIRKQMEAENG